MHDLIDAYVKLITSIITLLAPVLIFYINHVSLAREKKKASYETKIKDLQSSVQLDNSNSQTFTSQVSELHTRIAELRLEDKRNSNLLNPMRQLKRIYSTLLASFLFIIADMGVRGNILETYNHSVSILLILLSLICFLITCYRIYSIVQIAIKSKEEIENNN